MTQVIRYHRPHLYPKQRAAIFDPARIVVIEASTKSGKTHGCLAWAWERTLLARRGQNVWWVAPVYRQAKIAFRRLKRWLRKLGPYIDVSESELSITWKPTGAVIAFLSGDNPDNLYGEDVVDAVFDEASRAKEEAFFALRSTLTATRGRLRLIANSKGRRNWLYKLGERARAGEPDMAYHRLTAYDAVEGGVLQLEEVEAAKRLLPEHVFRELYLAEPSDDGANPFGMAHIAACLLPGLATGEPVAWGWDLAKSADWTVGIGLNAQRQVCRAVRWQHEPWRVTIDRIRRTVGRVPALIDSTGVGDPIVEALQEPYAVVTKDRLGREVTTQQRADGNITGFKFTGPSKQQLLEGLAVAIQQHDLGFPAGIEGFPAVLRTELEAFEYEVTRTGTRYGAPEGFHDDCVMALALAERCFATARRQTVPVLPPAHW